MFHCDRVFSAHLRRSVTLIVCHDLEMIMVHDMLSPAPNVATGASLSPRPSSQKQDAASGEHIALAVSSPSRRRFLKRNAIYLSP